MDVYSDIGDFMMFSHHWWSIWDDGEIILLLVTFCNLVFFLMNQIGHQNLQIVTNISFPTTVINMNVTIVDTDAFAGNKNWKVYISIYVSHMKLVKTTKLRGSAIILEITQ